MYVPVSYGPTITHVRLEYTNSSSSPKGDHWSMNVLSRIENVLLFNILQHVKLRNCRRLIKFALTISGIFSSLIFAKRKWTLVSSSIENVSNSIFYFSFICFPFFVFVGLQSCYGIPHCRWVGRLCRWAPEGSTKHQSFTSFPLKSRECWCSCLACFIAEIERKRINRSRTNGKGSFCCWLVGWELHACYLSHPCCVGRWLNSAVLLMSFE